MTASTTFANGTFEEAAISDIARALRAGTVIPSDLMINVLDRGLELLGFDTRSMLALRQANIPLSDWTLIDQTRNQAFESARPFAYAQTDLRTPAQKLCGLLGVGSLSASWWDGAP